MNNTKYILSLIKSLSKEKPVYVVGGWLRDKLLNRSNRDIDIAIAGNPFTLAKKFSNKISGSFVTLDTKNKIYRVVIKNNPEVEYVDFAKMKAADIMSDLKKRDFTINAMAVEIPESGSIDIKKIIDPCRGKNDIRNRIMRAASAQSFIDDPLRILRAFRIASQLDFKIEPSTLKTAKKYSGLILRSAPERSRDEIVKILDNKASALWIERLEKNGVLKHLVPEIIPMKKSARKFYFHPKGLWQHSEDTLRSLEEIFLNLKKYFPGNYGEIEKHLKAPLSSGVSRKIILKITALLHDCAKPECAVKSGKKTRFIGHEKKGAKKIEGIFLRLRLGRRETAIAKKITENHMRLISATQSGLVTRRAAFRLFRDLGENTPDLLLLSLADWQSYKRINIGKPKNLQIQKEALKELFQKYFTDINKQVSEKLIDGNILMAKLKLKPGPIIGRLLKEAKEAQALGKVKTEEEALALASRRLTHLAKKYKI